MNRYTFQLLPELFSKFVKKNFTARSASRRASGRNELEGNDSRGNNFQREFEKF
jgi:hypothetical protein